MRHFQWERAGTLGELPVPDWQTILTQRGFTGAVEHFIDCAANQTATCLSGEESISAQRWIEQLLTQREG